MPDKEIPNHVGEQLFEALTHQEITHLLEALLIVVPSHLRDAAVNQLSPDTRQTVLNILSLGQPASVAEPGLAKPVSMAKLEQTWASLWQEWDEVVDIAAQEEGPYFTQEAHWEPPYFDETAFITALEEIAKKMRPLMGIAVEQNFWPDISFVEALTAAEDNISAAMPEWIYLESFHLEENLTFCLLEWEWLKFNEEEQDAFAFARHILDLEDSFTYVNLDGNAFLDFFIQLPQPVQQAIFKGLTQHKDTPPWQSELSSVYSEWHIFYMHCVEQYAPEKYLDNLRATIPQQWQNGLPVIEDYLAQQDYDESLKVIEETIPALLKAEQIREGWTPEMTLLFPHIQQYNDPTRLDNYRKLLDYYQQTARSLGQRELVNALSLQLIAFEHCFDWETMFKAFEQAAIAEESRQSLFGSWRDYIIQRAKPYTWGFGWPRPADNPWWLHWLIDSIADQQKGPVWFSQQITRWLEELPGNQRALGENLEFLRLLTKDLTLPSGKDTKQYPQFYKVVIRPNELSSPDQSSRQAYLKQFAPPDLPDQLMVWWRTHLRSLVPRPEDAQKSDYTRHAGWMAALRELSSDDYEALLDKWRIEHHRRRNLWAALARLGLS